MADHGPASQLVGQMLAKNLNCPVTTSCGRLFDAVAAVTGLCLETTYEGQAAIVLERAQDLTEDRPYDCPLLADRTPAVLDTRTLFAQAATDAARGVAAGCIARRFHLGLAAGLTRLATAMARETGLDVVALGGGVMQNRTLAIRLPAALRAAGLRPLSHRRMPANDGCVSLGQAAFGLKQLRANN
jgi:hydrogenase maturation protein HypF